MSLQGSLAALGDSASPERAGERVVRRIEDAQALVLRELAEVEALVAARIDGGVAPATASARHLHDAGGKRVRPLAVLLAAACVSRRPSGVCREIAAAAELVHTATLLH